MPVDQNFLRGIRETELLLAAQHIPPHSRVLEIGSGGGWQAQQLQRLGHEVHGVEIGSSRYLPDAVWLPVLYDGLRLPFRTAAFDVIFSSNVLEHVPELEAFQQELRRVLRPGGRAVHVLPTSGWRLWTLLTHYPEIIRQSLALLGRRLSRSQSDNRSADRAPAPNRLWRALVPPRHGEHGSALGELYYFSRTRWTSLFRRSGWTLLLQQDCGLWYTGNCLLGARLSLETRRRLARLFGSVTRIFVLEKSGVPVR